MKRKEYKNPAQEPGEVNFYALKKKKGKEKGENTPIKKYTEKCLNRQFINPLINMGSIPMDIFRCNCQERLSNHHSQSVKST